jgi:hypothetical protein
MIMLRISIVLVALTVPAESVAEAGNGAGARPSKWAEYWHFWGQRVRAHALVYWQIIKAPKVHYRMEALEVYPNGVWAEYAVTNRTAETIILDRRWISEPVRRFSGFDDLGQEWQVPPSTISSVRFAEPDEFVLLAPKRTVRFRGRINWGVAKPLELVKPAPGGVPGRPLELTYLIQCWYHVYRRLPEEPGAPRYAWIATGGGKVSVKWFDKPYPKDWPVVTRLYGEPGDK